MGTATLSYTIPANGLPGNTQQIDVTLNLTYSDTVNGDGSHTVTGVTGTYKVGTTTYQITGVGATGGAEQADNHFWPSGDPNNSGAYVDFNGLNFVTSDPNADGNKQAGNGATPNVDFFYAAANNPLNTTHVAFYAQDQQTGLTQDAAATNLTESVTCYASGTLIRTGRGDVPVEELEVGDLVLTDSGALRPIKWIGHSKVDLRNHPRPGEALPIRIGKDAFGPGKPEQDLYVSRAHAIAVTVLDEMLVEACQLVNGATVAQVDMSEVTYWHVELESHDVLIANGLPAESYLDTGNRAFFECGEGDIDPRRDGEEARMFCRPFLDAEEVRVVRARLRARALAMGWTVANEPPLDLHAIADGVVIHPDVEGSTARFVLPASANEIWLVSSVSIPSHVSDTSDVRALGVSIEAMSIDDGIGDKRHISIEDPLICEGFHPLEADEFHRWRWTSGKARLPAELWEGCRGQFFLRLELAGPPAPRWAAPNFVEPREAASRQTRLRLLASN